MQGPNPPLTALLIQLDSIADISVREKAAIAALPLRAQVFVDGQQIFREGSSQSEVCVVLAGMACRHTMLSDGRRSIMSLHMAGDLPNLQSLHVGRLDFGLSALTRCRVAFIIISKLRDVMLLHASASEALRRHAAIDSAMSLRRIASVGRHTAIERVAYLICETFKRAEAVGIAGLSAFELPLTQAQIGEATGLSGVHVNRTMQELRRRRMIHSDGMTHAILDWGMLKQTAGFDSGYLNLRPHEHDAAARRM